MNWIREHKAISGAAAGVALVGAVFVLVWFQPQALFIDDVVNETLPQAAPTTTKPAQTPSSDTTAPAPKDAPGASTEPAPGEAPPTYPIVLSEGEFIGLAHAGTGRALIVELEDGTRLLRLEDLDIDNGPDLRVILSPTALVEDDGAYDDGDFFDLGELKGNKGSQNYDIPLEVDIDDYQTVAIWCRRFNVSFNAAAIGPPMS